MNKRKNVYPFTSIVGQEAMKEALVLNIISPGIGGVLIRGEKGTAKSTAVRALAELLPEREVVHGCQFGCAFNDEEQFCTSCREKLELGEKFTANSTPMQVVELPLSATEDRVAGTLDLEHAITKGKKKFEPGVLARANGNILYVDEVNLLDDHLVDLLLDAAAMGVNFVEREGVSFSHPSRFILVGTMNPEEGDLRPQLLDRFGLAVDVTGEQNVEQRKEIIKKRLAFENDPEKFIANSLNERVELTNRIIKARQRLPNISPDEAILEMAVDIALHLGVDGHRADLTLIKTAKTVAAFENCENIEKEHMLRAARLSLPHRMRRRPFEEGYLDMKELENWIQEM